MLAKHKRKKKKKKKLQYLTDMPITHYINPLLERQDKHAMEKLGLFKKLDGI